MRDRYAPRSVWMERLVRAIASGGALGCGAGVTAGADTGGDEPFDRALYQPGCTNDALRVFDEESLAGSDYAGLWTTGAGGDRYELVSVGTACPDASPPGSCLETIRSGEAPGYRFVATAAGGDVEIRDLAATKTWLGPIDSAEDALLVATLGTAYWGASCGPATPEETQGNLLRYTARPWVRRVDGGWEVLAVRYTDSCLSSLEQVILHVTESGALTDVAARVVTNDNGCVGRLPPGCLPSEAPPAAGLGGWFAAMSELEALSVPSFLRLRAELASFGAPRALLDRCQSAAGDEVRHAADACALANRFGGAPSMRAVAQLPLRSLQDVALDNAVEGCARETFGAALAAWQAEHATDPAVKAVLSAIAYDEARHAALAWDVARWLDPWLTSAERDGVVAARHEALGSLDASAPRLTRSEVRAVGLPYRPRDFVAEFRRAVTVVA